MRIKNFDNITFEEQNITVDEKHHAPILNFEEIDAQIIVLSYQPGVGKSYNTMQYMIDHPFTYYLTERHDTIEEMQEEYGAEFPEYHHWEGFPRKCENKDYKKIISKNKNIPHSLLCKKCNIKDCDYSEQFNHRIRIFSPIEYLSTAYIIRNSPETIFIDEMTGKVKTCSFKKDEIIEVFQRLHLPYEYIKAINDNNFAYFSDSILRRIRERQKDKIEDLLESQNYEELTNINKLDIYEFKDYIRIGKKYNYNRTSYGFPFYYYAFDAVNRGSKIVLLDATFLKNLFKYFIYSYNGEIGFKKKINVKIYKTEISNKNTIVFRMKSYAWHPKISFKDKLYLESTNQWLQNHIKRIREIFGEENVGIITFQFIGEKCKLLGYNVEYFNNLRSKNTFTNKPVLVILGHFFPPMIKTDKEGNPKTEGIIEMIDNWFLRDPDTYSIVELQEYVQNHLRQYPETYEKIWALWRKRFTGNALPRRFIDKPNSTSFTDGDTLKLLPVRTIQDYFDNEIYQAIHRNRGLQNNRIIFLYCWIPPYYRWIIGDTLYRLRNEFDFREIQDREEDDFFNSLKDQIGDRKLVTKLLNMIDYDNKSDTEIAKDTKLWKKKLWTDEIIDGRGGPANLYIKILREGIYKRDVGRTKIKQEKYSIDKFLN